MPSHPEKKSCMLSTGTFGQISAVNFLSGARYKRVCASNRLGMAQARQRGRVCGRRYFLSALIQIALVQWILSKKKKKEKQPGGLISLRMAAVSLENTECDSKGSWLSLCVRTLDDIKHRLHFFLPFWQEFTNFTHQEKLMWEGTDGRLSIFLGAVLLIKYGVKAGCIRKPEAPQEEEPALPCLIYCHSVISRLQVANSGNPFVGWTPRLAATSESLLIAGLVSEARSVGVWFW